jgi:hypothetical protein
VHWIRAGFERDGQTIEDVARLLVGVDAPETVTVTGADQPLRLYPGETAAIDLELASDAASAVSAQVQLVSPWHTWDLFPDASTGVEIPPGGSARLQLPVRVPDGHRPGRWWALAKIAHAGQLQYTAPIEIEVRS